MELGPEQRLKPCEDLGQNMLCRFPGPLGLSRTPIEASELVDQDHARQSSDALERHFERIALDPGRHRTCKGKADAPIESRG
jgi:hypothetical protein